MGPKFRDRKTEICVAHFVNFEQISINLLQFKFIIPNFKGCVLGVSLKI